MNTTTKIYKSKRVACPDFGQTSTGCIPRADVIKNGGYLPTGSGNDYQLTAIELDRVRRLGDDCGDCDLDEMPAVKLTTSTGYTWSTSVAHGLTVNELTRYFVGVTFDCGTFDESKPNAGEDMQQCTKIEFIN